MIIKRQDGIVEECYEIETQGTAIKYTPKSDRRKREVCGVYESIKRATEVFTEMTLEGWNNKNPYYEMPLK